MKNTMKRKTAAKLGLHKYSTGKPCKNGHSGLRYTDTGACIGCNGAYQKRIRKIRSEAANENLGGENKLLTIPCHPDDTDAILQFANALTIARTLT